MIIDLRIIPHADQRYDTCGDYWQDGETAHFRVSKLSDPRYQWLIFLHELVEKRLVEEAGIALDTIDEFDIAYELARANEQACAPCGCPIQAEPGWDRHAPYYWQHRYAERVERIAAEALGVDWIAYDREVESL